MSEKREELAKKVFELANELAVEGFGDEAIALHRVHNGLASKDCECGKPWNIGGYCVSCGDKIRIGK